MTFLNNISRTTRVNTNTTKGIYLGTPEAEGENREGQSLIDFYEDYMGILQDIKNEKFIISGRKGSGKSAIVKYFRDHSSEDNELYSATVKHSDIVLEKAIQYYNEPEDDIYSHLYEWIILTKFVYMLLQTTDVRSTKEYNALLNFQKKNSGLLNVDEWKTLNFEKEHNRQINFSPFKAVFQAELGQTIKTTNIKADFISFIPALREIVMKMLRFQGLERFNFIVLFDDLDINFKLTRTVDKKRILNLIRITRDYNTQYLLRTNSKILIFIRDDVSNQLVGTEADKSKIFASYETRLNWYDDNIREEDSMLRKFINKRIQLAFNKLGLQCNKSDPWLSLIHNSPCEDYKDKTAFKFILEFTYYLPRDILLVFKDLEKKEFQIPMEPKDVKLLLKEYVKKKKDEITDELVIQFEDSNIETERIIEALRELSNNTYNTMKDVLSCLNNFGLNENLFSLLLDYNLLVPRDERGNLYYKYRNQEWSGDLTNYYFRLPKCLFCYYHENQI
jgi:hypothetical protein